MFRRLTILCSFIGVVTLHCTGTVSSLRSTSVSTLTISSPTENQTITSFLTTFSGACDSSKVLTVTPGSSAVTIISSSCVGATLTISVGFKAGSESRSVTVAQGSESVTRTITFNHACPTGFIGVPGSAAYSTSDFCVAKYEAKPALNDGTDVDNAGTTNLDHTLHIVESRASGMAWNTIQRGASAATNDSAFQECAEQGWTLITNSQWQTIARNIEANSVNWGSGVVGTGGLYIGLSDDVGQCGTGVACAADVTGDPDDDPYVNTSNNAGEAWASGAEQKRTHTLSNGEKVWDIGGNINEWVADNITGTSLSPALSAAQREYSNLLFFAFADPVNAGLGLNNRDLFGPAGNYDSTHYIGYHFGGAGGAAFRGGNMEGFNGASGGGIFETYLSYAHTVTDDYVGFRCAAP